MLASEFDPRRNSLTLLRLGLALVVAVTHGQVNGFGWQPQVGATEIGQVALDGFFVISGFLVTRSYLSLQSFPRFTWHRFLRIVPGFWVCLVVVALVVAPVAALLEGRSVAGLFSGDRSALDYVLRNAALLMRQDGIAGLLADTPNNEAFDGSLWTLFYEALCYALLGVVGVCGILQRRRWLVALGTVALLGALLTVDTGLLPLAGSMPALVVRFAFLFSLGATAWLYADRLPISGVLAAPAALLVVLALLTLEDYRPLGAVGLAYVLVWAIVRTPLRWSPRMDLSYGIYIYHWPVQQLLVLAGATSLGTTPFVSLSLVAAAGCAAMSWTLVERPALGQKNARWVDRVRIRARADAYADSANQVGHRR